jgi:hypothetical protein
MTAEETTKVDDGAVIGEEQGAVRGEGEGGG